MKFLLINVTLLLQIFSFAQTESYPVDSASVEHAGVPKGEIIRFKFTGSKIFPGTVRDVSVYVPAQYKSATPACVYVNQDGIQWKAPTVFDNLIHNKEMPVTIGVFVTPGIVPADSGANAQSRYNRSFEYDGLGDAYARFILTEIFPEVERQNTKDGRSIRLSKSGNDRAIGGSSSGAVCAFTAAWEHPEEFSRVFSAIGTYVGLRGADRYPTLVRKYEPKRLRIFLQDGSNDLNIYAGDWWMANQTIQRALTFAGYEVTQVWGEGGHNGSHGTSIFPNAMRWLWKDWPKPVTKGTSKNQFLSDLLIQNEDWKTAEEPHQPIKNLSVDEKGNVYSKDLAKKKIASNPPADQSNIELTKNPGKKIILDKELQAASIALTPDQTQVLAALPNSHWIWIYKINKNGTLAFQQRYGWLHSPDDDEGAGATALQCDTAGRIYVATKLGVQVLDQLGRVNAILPLPTSEALVGLCFGGAAFDTLYVATKNKLYYRKLKTRGANTFEPPLRPANPRL